MTEHLDIDDEIDILMRLQKERIALTIKNEKDLNMVIKAGSRDIKTMVRLIELKDRLAMKS